MDSSDIARGDITIFNYNFLVDFFFQKSHHGVQETLLVKEKIKITRFRKVKFVKMPKMSKISTFRSIVELTQIDQSVSFTCQIFRFFYFFDFS